MHSNKMLSVLREKMDGSICAFEVFQMICLANSKTVQHSTEKQQRQIAELTSNAQFLTFLKMQ